MTPLASISLSARLDTPEALDSFQKIALPSLIDGGADVWRTVRAFQIVGEKGDEGRAAASRLLKPYGYDGILQQKPDATALVVDVYPFALHGAGYLSTIDRYRAAGCRVLMGWRLPNNPVSVLLFDRDKTISTRQLVVDFHAAAKTQAVTKKMSNAAPDCWDGDTAVWLHPDLGGIVRSFQLDCFAIATGERVSSVSMGGIWFAKDSDQLAVLDTKRDFVRRDMVEIQYPTLRPFMNAPVLLHQSFFLNSLFFHSGDITWSWRELDRLSLFHAKGMLSTHSPRSLEMLVAIKTLSDDENINIYRALSGRVALGTLLTRFIFGRRRAEKRYWNYIHPASSD